MQTEEMETVSSVYTIKDEKEEEEDRVLECDEASIPVMSQSDWSSTPRALLEERPKMRDLPEEKESQPKFQRRAQPEIIIKSHGRFGAGPEKTIRLVPITDAWERKEHKNCECDYSCWACK